PESARSSGLRLLSSSSRLIRLFGIFARQHEVGAVAKLVAKFGPAHGFLRMSAGNVVTAFDHFAVLELDSNSRAHLIVTEGFQFVVDIKRYPLHQLDNFAFTDLSIDELRNTRFALQNGYGHAKRNAELSFQRRFRHRVNQSIGNVGIWPDIDGFDVIGAKIMFPHQIEYEILRRVRQRTRGIRFDRDPRILDEEGPP